MLLRDISLVLSYDEYEGIYDSDFQFRSRYLLNFVRRRIVPLRFKTDGFGSIVIEGRHEPKEECWISCEKVAGVSVFFDQRRYDALEPDECHEFFIGMVVEGVEKLARHYQIPLSEIESAIADFRTGGYRNVWTHKKRTFRAVGLQASLNCCLDMEKFALTLKLERKGTVVYDAQILETRPDEICFAHKFKDVMLEGHTVVVRNKSDKPMFSLNLNSLAL